MEYIANLKNKKTADKKKLLLFYAMFFSTFGTERGYLKNGGKMRLWN